MARRALQAVFACLQSLCGWVAYRIGCRATARRHYERVLLLRGADFSAYVHLGRIAFDLGDYAGWRREFEHARRADPVRFTKLRHPFELFEPRLAGTDFDSSHFDASGSSDGTLDRGFDDTGARATWRSLRPLAPGRRGPSPRSGDSPLETGFDAMLPGVDSRNGQAPKGDSAKSESPKLGDDLPDGNDRSAGGFADPHFDGMPPADRRSRSVQDDCVSAAERLRFGKLGPIVPSELLRCNIDELVRKLSG